MWKKITSKVLITHPRLTVIEDQVELPDGSQVPYLKFDHKNDSVTVLCFNADDELLLQQEYSYPPDTMLYQFPGGKIEAGESPLEAARRELREESGLEGKVFTSIGWYYAHNRRSADKAHVFVVKNATKTRQFGGDPEESITSEWITVKKFTELISDGQIQNNNDHSKGGRTCRVCGNHWGLVRKYGVNMCRQCFRAAAPSLGFVKYR